MKLSIFLEIQEREGIFPLFDFSIFCVLLEENRALVVLKYTVSFYKTQISNKLNFSVGQIFDVIFKRFCRMLPKPSLLTKVSEI